MNTGASTSRTAGGDVSLTGVGDLRALVCGSAWQKEMSMLLCEED